MSRINIVLLLSVYILTACAYIDNGTSVAPEKVSSEQLTGCYYNESYIHYIYLRDDLYCRKYCFSNDSAYYEERTYNVTFAEDSSRIVTLSGSESYVDQAKRLEPEKNGAFFFNLQITGFRNYVGEVYYGDSLVKGYWFTDDVMFREEGGIKYLDMDDIDYSTKAWTLCAF